MASASLITASVLVFIASLVHLLFFFMESVFWRRPAVWRRFGVTTQEHAELLRPMAFNQGFYNVFLAVGGGIGLVLIGTGDWAQGGLVLCLFVMASMLAAAIVLIVSSPKFLRAAVLQGLPPLLAIVFLVIAIV
jgi:putative membrane protein